MKSAARRSASVWWMGVIVLSGFFSQTFAEADSGEEDEVRKRSSPVSGGSSSLPLHLIWWDNYELLSRSFETAAAEVSRVFGELGVEVRWSVGAKVEDQASATRDRVGLYVVLLPSRSSSWGLEEGVMGVATHRGGLKGSAYIFYPEITRILNIDPEVGGARDPRSQKLLARAIGRVVVHELVHVLAPEHPHTSTGLMDANLTRRFLVQPKAHLDPMSSRVVQAEVRALVNRTLLASEDVGPSVVGSTEDELPTLRQHLLPHPRQ